MAVQLSYSTIANCLQPNNSHNWISKQMGLKPQERPEWKQGTEGHRIIQAHVSREMLNKNLSHLDSFYFPVVERVDFDKNCKFWFEFSPGYSMIGYFDGINEPEHRMLEIKLAGEPWSIGKFNDLIQRKIYSIAKPTITELICITGLRDPELWGITPPKVYKVPMTENDRSAARTWIQNGINVLESGDFSGGLTDGVCTDPRCYFGDNCSFKNI